MEASGGLSSLGGIVKPEYRQAQARALVSKKIAPPTGERRPPHPNYKPETTGMSSIFATRCRDRAASTGLQYVRGSVVGVCPACRPLRRERSTLSDKQLLPLFFHSFAPFSSSSSDCAQKPT